MPLSVAAGGTRIDQRPADGTHRKSLSWPCGRILVSRPVRTPSSSTPTAPAAPRSAKPSTTCRAFPRPRCGRRPEPSDRNRLSVGRSPAMDGITDATCASQVGRCPYGRAAHPGDRPASTPTTQCPSPDTETPGRRPVEAGFVPGSARAKHQTLTLPADRHRQPESDVSAFANHPEVAFAVQAAEASLLVVLQAAGEFEAGDPGAPVERAARLEVFAGVPEGAVIDRIDRHGAVVAPAGQIR